MATRNFCDICDKPAVKEPELVSVTAHELNKVMCSRYENNSIRFAVSWSTFDKYNDTIGSGHVCKDCLIAALQQHIKNLQAQA